LKFRTAGVDQYFVVASFLFIVVPLEVPVEIPPPPLNTEASSLFPARSTASNSPLVFLR
jgi:hypothetical protein